MNVLWLEIIFLRIKIISIFNWRSDYFFILNQKFRGVVGKIIVGVFFAVNYFGPRVYLEESSFITFL